MDTGLQEGPDEFSQAGFLLHHDPQDHKSGFWNLYAHVWAVPSLCGETRVCDELRTASPVV